MPITVTEILDVQRIDEFCKEIMSRKDHGTSRLVENEYAALRKVSPDEDENLQLVLPEVLRPRLVNLTHH